MPSYAQSRRPPRVAALGFTVLNFICGMVFLSLTFSMSPVYGMKWMNIFSAPIQEQRFQYAVSIVLKHEGSFSDNKFDPGGATNFGISLRYLQSINLDVDNDGDVDKNDIRKLSQQDAKDIYRKHWWDKYKYYQIRDLNLATKVFDLAVNTGSKQANRILQRAINSSQSKRIKVDGIFGPNTLLFSNTIPADKLIDAVRQEAKHFYLTLIQKQPLLKEFKNGWLRRAAW
jgi:lysozyme family protein